MFDPTRDERAPNGFKPSLEVRALMVEALRLAYQVQPPRLMPRDLLGDMEYTTRKAVRALYALREAEALGLNTRGLRHAWEVAEMNLASVQAGVTRGPSSPFDHHEATLRRHRVFGPIFGTHSTTTDAYGYGSGRYMGD